MKRLKSAVFLLFCVFWGGIIWGGIEEWVSVVQVTDNFKQNTYQILTNERYTQLTKDLWHRNRNLEKAIRMARDEWQKAEGTKDKVYPVNITCKAEVKRLKTFPDEEKAKEYIAYLEAEDAKKAEVAAPKTYLGRKIEALEDEINRALKLQMTGERKKFIEDRKKEIAVLREELAERKAKEAELKAIEGQAQSLIAAKIDALIAESPAPNYETPKAF
jgi:hypothetical protein